MAFLFTYSIPSQSAGVALILNGSHLGPYLGLNGVSREGPGSPVMEKLCGSGPPVTCFRTVSCKIELHICLGGAVTKITLYRLHQLGIQDEGDLSQTTYGAVTVVADTLQQEKLLTGCRGECCLNPS